MLRAVLKDVLNGKVTLAFVAYEWEIFADEKRVSCEEVSDYGFCNDNFLSSGEVFKKDRFFLKILILFMCGMESQ